MIRQTHTHANLRVSAATYSEVERLLRDANYDHAFNGKGEIDMHGIALVRRETLEPVVNLHDTVDAAAWAAEFVRIHGGDEGLMLGWFANAIMASYDHAIRLAASVVEPSPHVEEERTCGEVARQVRDLRPPREPVA